HSRKYPPSPVPFSGTHSHALYHPYPSPSSSSPLSCERKRKTSFMGPKNLMVCAVMITAVIFCASPTIVHSSGDLHHAMEWFPARSAAARCDGSIAECLADEEFDLDSEVNRRILATSSYISYAALKRNSVPCSRRGASYYNCKPGAQANPYTRGCSAITRCRS
ncbi:Rapid ALkalinization Factor, partial [Dillenia turbinata]